MQDWFDSEQQESCLCKDLQKMPWKKSTRTEIVHIVVTGYQKKKQPSKYYVFVIDVTWNNSERFEVYRRYSDFFSFQTTLKALFPIAAGRRNTTERVIPQLPKRIFVGRSHVARVAEARLEQINRYCQTLISLEPRISESAHVVGFFSPRIGDKQLPKLHLHRPASLHPEKIPLGSMFEEYCALAEYVAEDESQISFKPGDKVLVMSKDQSGWWMCGVDGKVGWAPPSYLKKCEEKMNESDESDEEFGVTYPGQNDKDSDDSGVGDNSASEPSTPASSIDSIKNFVSPEIKAEAYKAIDAYQADGPGQVSFDIGDTIHVLDKLEDGWWFVSNGREEGWAPCSYLEGEKEEEALTNLDNIERYYAVDNYQAEEDDEISFKKGVVLDVMKKSLDGWWVVKMDSVVGLAPATFLKKVETQEQAGTPQGSERKISLPGSHSPLSPIKAFQQPPRKQSVRARASMRMTDFKTAAGRPGPSKLAVKQFTPLPPISPESTPPPSTHSTQDPFSSPEVPRRPFPREPQTPPKKSGTGKKPKPIPASDSPDVSDSDPEENYLNYAFQQFAVGPVKSRSVSRSESSVGEETTSPKPPVATPRKKVRSQSMKTASPDSYSSPPLPPRPREDDRDASSRPPVPPPRPSNIPTIRKHKSLDETEEEEKEEPTRPSRPRMSEIKRAKNRARAAKPRSNKNAPSLTVVDEDGFETMSTISSKSSKSTNSYSSSKSAPVVSGGGGVREGKKRTVTDPRANFLSPDTVERQRARSADENTRKPAGSKRGEEEGEGALGGVALNTETAGKLLSLIMTSEDPGLKAALRELITQDSSVASSIQGHH